MKRTLFIIGAGKESVPGIKKAKQMGLNLIIADGNPNAPGLAYADHIVIESTYDEKSLLAAARDYASRHGDIDGVIAMCTDVPKSATCIAEAFGLISLSPESAHLVSDKYAMKCHLRDKHIAIPSFEMVSNHGDLPTIAEKLGFPFVIKPVDSRGARGVQLIEHATQFEQAWLEAYKESPTGRVMAERFLTGPQISTEALIVDGQTYTSGFTDRNYEWLERYKPYIIENGGTQPTLLSESQAKKVTKLFEQAALALGITNGVAKGDMVLCDGEPYVIEIAGRLSGGFFSSTQIPLATGVDFIRQAIRIALGEKPAPEELMPTERNGVAIRYLTPEPGTVKNISGVEDAELLPGVIFADVDIEIGEQVQQVTNHTKRAGIVLTVGKDRQDALNTALQAIDTIKISTKK